MRLHFLDSFYEDLADLWEHIAEHNQNAADRLVDRLYERCGVLTQFPEAGPARPDIHPECRVLAIDEYLLLYSVRDDGVRLRRVLHERRHQSGIEWDAGA